MPSSGRSRAAGLLVGLALGLAAAPSSAQELRTIPVDDWRYTIADALLLRRPELSDEVWLSIRPWRQEELQALVAEARGSGREDRLSGAWLDLLASGRTEDPDPGPVSYHNRVSARYEGRARSEDATFDPAFRETAFGDRLGEPANRAVLQHDFALQFREHFGLGWRYVVDSNLRNDPTRRAGGERGTDAAFEVLDAYATARIGPLWADVGRLAFALGPGLATSPFVSDSAPSMDQVRLELHAEPVRLTALIAQLSRERPNRRLRDDGATVPGSIPSDEDPVPFDVTRILYLHRFDWQVLEYLQLAISEAALVTGIDRGIELRFANPLIPYFVTQNDEDEVDGVDVNVNAVIEGVYTGLGTSRLFGQLFVQEFFIDAEEREEIGNQLAWKLGGVWADPLGWYGGDLAAEYTRVDVFTYLHRGLNTDWETFGVPIGSSLGPDADQLVLEAGYWTTPTTRATVDLLRRRGGERDIRTLESVIEAGNPDFPSGVAQEEWRLGAEVWGMLPRRGLEGRARVSRRFVEDIGNEEGRDGEFWRLAIDLIWRWQP